MALSGWNADKKIRITIPAQAETLTDIPLLVNLSAASGTSDFDCSAVFDEISPLITNSANWLNTVLALTMEGANNSTAFTDLTGKTVTANGNAKISSTKCKFGATSAYFDGAGDYLSVPNSADFDFAAGDLTIECWINVSAIGTARQIFDTREDGVSRAGLAIQVTTAGKIEFYASDNDTSAYEVDVLGSTVLLANTWYHVACVRYGSSWKIFINGTLDGSATASFSISHRTTIKRIGMAQGTLNPYLGYIDNFRVIKGVALYTANFAKPEISFHPSSIVGPRNFAIENGDTGQQCFVEIEKWDSATPSAQLWVRVPEVSSSTSTVLNLYYDSTHAENTAAIDPQWTSTVLALPMDGPEGSTTFTDFRGHAITAAGNAKISTTQSKFGGASAYFDGTGDYLTTPASADFNFGTGDFTIEGELFISGDSALNSGGTRPAALVYCRAAGNFLNGFEFGLNGSATTTGTGISFGGFDGATQTISGVSATYSFEKNTWYHVAVSRSSGVIYLFINGDLVFSASKTGNIAGGVNPIYVGGCQLTGYYHYLIGNIDDLRVTKGVARYTASFTPPTRSVLEDAQGYVGDIGTHAAHQVWAPEYLAVYHLSQDPSTTIKESTSNARNLTPSGSMTTAQLVAGPVGKALELDGANDYLAAAASNLSALQTAFTIECNGKLNDSENGTLFVLIGSPTTGGITLARDGVSGFLNSGVWDDDATSTCAIVNGEYSTYGQVFSIGVISAFKNGVLSTVPNIVTVQTLTSAPINIGGYSTFYFNEAIRTIRLSKVARSTAWLEAAYDSDFDQLFAYEDGAATIISGDVVPAVPVIEGLSIVGIIAIGDVSPIMPTIEGLTATAPQGPSVTAKSVVFDFDNNWGYSTFLGVRRIEFILDDEVIPMTTGFTAYSEGENSSNYVIANAFNTSLSKTGSWYQTSWLSTNGTVGNTRVSIVFTTPLTFDTIVINNSHFDGGSLTTGIKDTQITISDDAITSVNGAWRNPISNSTVLFDGTIAQHTAANTADDQVIWSSNIPQIDCFGDYVSPHVDIYAGGLSGTILGNVETTIPEISGYGVIVSVGNATYTPPTDRIVGKVAILADGLFELLGVNVEGVAKSYFYKGQYAPRKDNFSGFGFITGLTSAGSFIPRGVAVAASGSNSIQCSANLQPSTPQVSGFSGDLINAVEFETKAPLVTAVGSSDSYKLGRFVPGRVNVDALGVVALVGSGVFRPRPDSVEALGLAGLPAIGAGAFRPRPDSVEAVGVAVTVCSCLFNPWQSKVEAAGVATAFGDGRFTSQQVKIDTSGDVVLIGVGQFTAAKSQVDAQGTAVQPVDGSAQFRPERAGLAARGIVVLSASGSYITKPVTVFSKGVSNQYGAGGFLPRKISITGAGTAELRVSSEGSFEEGVPQIQGAAFQYAAVAGGFSPKLIGISGSAGYVALVVGDFNAAIPRVRGQVIQNNPGVLEFSRQQASTDELIASTTSHILEFSR